MLKFIAPLLLSLLPLAAADVTTLQIVVTNQDGKPIDNASVVVKFKGGHKVEHFGLNLRTEWELKTSQEGIAKVPSIPQGKILIQVIAKNYQTFGDTYDVREEEKTIEIKLNRPQSQYTAH